MSLKVGKNFYIISGLFFLFFIFFITTNVYYVKGQGFALRNNKLSMHFLHTYRSLRKFPDILFMPYYFKKVELPVFNLFITPENIALLNKSLPENTMGGILMNENKVWVDSIFNFGDYQGEVKVKYRGIIANNWNSMQRSLRIEFPSDHLFNGMKMINLVISYDNRYFVEPTNMHRANKLDLEAPDMNFVRLKINGQDNGVYLAFDHWSNQWSAKKGLPDNITIFGVDDGSEDYLVDQLATSTSLFTDKGSVYWKKYTKTESYGELKSLVKIIEEADDDTFKQIIGNLVDIDKFYSWNIINILAGSNYQTDIKNIIMIFNPAIGKFEFIPWNVELLAPEDEDIYRDNNTALARRLYKLLEFRAERNLLLEGYLNNTDNLESDLEFYDNLFDKTKIDFYQDSAKLHNNFQFLSQVKKYRKLLIDNFNKAKAVLEYETEYYQEKNKQSKSAVDIILPDSFSRFFETGYSIDEFISHNPEFYKINKNIIKLSSSAHVFKKDVIIPINLQVIIDAGATIYLDKDVSIISYSPIIAEGTSNQPIKILPLNSINSWGTFAVVNTESNKSIIKHTEFNNGSGAIINGIIFTGMAAFHNADVDVDNSIFKNAGDDDALNVKYGQAIITNSFFTDNFSDAIDIDIASAKTVIKDNKFYDNGYGGGGDAIDLSWSDILITNNDINGCTDKGVSVGEKSSPIIKNNIIKNCDIGIAVKDLSVAEIIGNNISDTRVGVTAYQKKQEFGGGIANVSAIKLENTTIDYEQDEISVVNVSE